MAIGAAMGGLRPVAELMTVNFSVVALDQIMNHAAVIRYMFGGKVKLPLTIRMPGGGGNQLGAQHSRSLEPLFAQIPRSSSRGPVVSGGCQGFAQGRHSLRRPP